MTVRGGVRFKPDMYRSSLESTVGSLDPSATPPTGTVFMVVQLAAWDDADFAGVTYTPGDPATESLLTILYEDTLSMELAAFAGKTEQQATAMWAAALANWKNYVAPAALTLLNATRGARLTPPSLY